MSEITVHHGDSRDVLKTLPDCSIDSVVCDPPYALVSIGKRFGKPGSAAAKSDGASGVYARASAGFMGQQWDVGETAFAVEFWAEIYRVLKPGAHVVAFSGTRTYHRLACAIEDAGFDIRDQGAWVYASGFPKSHDVAKGIDKHLGHERKKVRVAAPKNPPNLVGGIGKGGNRPWVEKAREAGFHEAASHEAASHEAASHEAASHEAASHEAASHEAASWGGWGTALKPAWEPICIARKPLDGTVAANVLKWGVGALNIEGCRIDGAPRTTHAEGNFRTRNSGPTMREGFGVGEYAAASRRWPANVVHDGSDEVLAAFPTGLSSGVLSPHHNAKASANGSMAGSNYEGRIKSTFGGDTGSAARFFYSAKADAEDRLGSKHPTVKPVDLMQWLCRLVTPPKTVALVCETCDNPPHDGAKLQALRGGPDEPATGDLLLREVPGGGREIASAAMQGLRQADQAPAPEALLDGVSSGVSAGGCEDAASSSLRPVRDGVQAEEGRGQAVLLEGLQREGCGLRAPEGQDQNGDRILAGLPARSSDGDAGGLHHGAPVGHGRDAGAHDPPGGGGSSHQRGQGRQPTREPDGHDKDGSRSGVENAEESRSQVPPLSGFDPTEQLCPKCGGGLRRIERPGLILDPFAGSGSTGVAAMNEGFDCILIEREERFVADINRRIAWARGEGRLTVQEMARDVKPDEAAGADLPLFSGAA